MTNTSRLFIAVLSFSAYSLIGSSCQKENSVSTTADNTSATIAVAASETAALNGTADSVYLLQPCAPGYTRDSVDAASLPADIITYLESNYGGYTFYKAFAITSSAGTTAGYAVVIYYNDKPVGILFDSNGAFVKVLEQREKGDLHGRGWHHGGLFGDRGDHQQDTIALADLPAAILTYMADNYPGDTLTKAFMNRDSSYLLLSVNNGVFATLFDTGGNFVKRIQVPAKKGEHETVEQDALPGSILSYLEDTYPNYVFKKAFLITAEETVQGYVVLIDANGTKYAVQFDASGNYISSKTIC